MVRAGIVIDMFVVKVQKAEVGRKMPFPCFSQQSNRQDYLLREEELKKKKRVLNEMEKIWELLRDIEKGTDQSQVQEVTISTENQA